MSEYWTPDEIDKTGANYRIVYGERGPGKTYSFKKKAIDNFIEHGKTFAYVRRRVEEIKPGKLMSFFDDISEYLNRRMIEKWPGFDDFVIMPKAGTFTLYGYTEGRRESIATFGHYFALANSRYNKSVPYPDVNLFCYDEFLVDESKGEYELPGEFSLLLNLISTIKRKRTDFIVYMFGNTVNRNSTVLSAMNINVRDIPQGSIKCYEYRDGDIVNKVAVEYTRHYEQSSESESFFVFNSKREMMIRDGSFEVDSYATFTEDSFYSARPKHGILFDCPDFRLYGYVMTNGELWVTPKRMVWSGTYITLTTGESFPNRRTFNWNSGIERIDHVTKKIDSLAMNGKIRFQDDYTGDDFRHFLFVAKSKGTV